MLALRRVELHVIRQFVSGRRRGSFLCAPFFVPFCRPKFGTINPEDATSTDTVQIQVHGQSSVLQRFRTSPKTVARALQIGRLLNQLNTMKNETYSAEGFESTYALLVRSEDKGSIFEDAAYLIFILSAVFSIWYVAQQPVPLPKAPVIHTSVTHSAGSHQST